MSRNTQAKKNMFVMRVLLCRPLATEYKRLVLITREPPKAMMMIQCDWSALITRGRRPLKEDH